MAKSYIYIPFDRDFYNDIVRFSDGKLDPAHLAEEQIASLIESELDNLAFDWFGDRLLEFVRIHFPYEAERIESELSESNDAPLVWKEVIVHSASEVRMRYERVYHFARVKDGKIEDDDGRFSPSEWASKVANGTNRNAWRDLEFKDYRGTWIRADTLRSKWRKIQSDLDEIEIELEL